jgi:hypothetical protein
LHGFLGMIVLSTPLLSAEPESRGELRETSRCKQIMTKVGRAIGAGLVLGALTVATPRVYYQAQASSISAEHIGSGILLDMEKIESLLTSEERELLQDSNQNKTKIIEMFAQKISGDYDMQFLNHGRTHLLPARLASSYFEGQCDRRGVCRDKSLVLASILRHYGIRAEVRSASETELQANGHEWVYLPDLDAVIDPTMKEFNFKVIAATEYVNQLRQFGFSIDSYGLVPNGRRYIQRSFQR